MVFAQVYLFSYLLKAEASRAVLLNENKSSVDARVHREGFLNRKLNVRFLLFVSHDPRSSSLTTVTSRSCLNLSGGCFAQIGVSQPSVWQNRPSAWQNRRFRPLLGTTTILMEGRWLVN